MTTSEFHAAVSRAAALTDGQGPGIGYPTTVGSEAFVRWEDGTKGRVDVKTLRRDETKRLPSYAAQRFMLAYEGELDNERRRT